MRSLGTHDGTFHADEVTATALFLHFNLIDRDKIVRTRDLKKLAACEFVCDVGGVYDPSLKRFDHHQSDYKGEMSSAGMVWNYLRDEGIIDCATFEYLEENLIRGIDAHDNGRECAMEGTCTFSHIIANFVPIQYDASDQERDRAFYEALDFVLGHLKRTLARHHFILEAQGKVQKAMEKGKDLLEFDEPLPWLESFFALGGENHTARFVLMPSGGHWKLRAIPPSIHDRMNVRKPLPSAWAGLLDQELEKASGIRGAVFCHKGRFISVWETREAAMEAYRKI